MRAWSWGRAQVFWSLAGIGFALRLVLAATTRGTNDVGIFEGLQRHVREIGLARTYETIALMNHPPPIVYYDLWVYSLHSLTGISFPLLLKIPGLVGEGIAAWVLWRVWSRASGAPAAAGVVCLFAWSLVSILISGFHGNTDCLYAALALLSAYLVTRRRPLGSGLALAGALSVKLIPLLLIPALSLQWRSRRELLRFAAGVSIALLPFVPFLVVTPAAVIRNTFGYVSTPDLWGITGLLTGLQNVWPLSAFATDARDFFLAYGKYFLGAVVVVLAVLARGRLRWGPLEVTAAVLISYLTLTPGFGVQHLVVVVPALFAVRPGLASVYSTLAGVFALVLYLYWLVPGVRPFQSEFRGLIPPLIAMFGMLPWGFLAFKSKDLLEQRGDAGVEAA